MEVNGALVSRECWVIERDDQLVLWCGTKEHWVLHDRSHNSPCSTFFSAQEIERWIQEWKGMSFLQPLLHRR